MNNGSGFRGVLWRTHHVSTLEVEAGGTAKQGQLWIDTVLVPVGPVWATGAAIWNRWRGWGGVFPSHYNKWSEHSKTLPANDFILFSLQFIETKSHSVIQTSLNSWRRPCLSLSSAWITDVNWHTSESQKHIFSLLESLVEGRSLITIVKTNNLKLKSDILNLPMYSGGDLTRS